MSSTEGGDGGTASASLVVNPPTITINDVTMAEGHSGTTSFSFTVSLSHTFPTDVTVQYDTVPGTTNPATEGACGGGNDYEGTSGTATISANTTSTTIVVPVCGDTNSEPDETFAVNLSGNSANSSILDGEGVGTITNDDIEVTISLSPASVTEDGATNLVYTFARTENTAAPLTVNFSSAVLPATFSTDYAQTGADSFTAPAGRASTFISCSESRRRDNSNSIS